MHQRGVFVHTVRRDAGGRGQPEGDNLRYSAMVALGLAYVDEASQRAILDGMTAADLAELTASRAETAKDLGAVALAVWANAEAGGRFSPALVARLQQGFASGAPIETVIAAWTVIAAVAGRRLGDTTKLLADASKRLMSAQGKTGIFPHVLSAGKSGLRGHVGCFADQVYPIQALARLATATGDDAALEAADRCAAQICLVQGKAGQWWWHYDSRDGSVVEGYPVYSVHQHAMAPMALLDLIEAGGKAHWPAMVSGLRWLEARPESTAQLIDETENVVWRKVARREPNKAVRAISGFTTALAPGLHLPGLDLIFPPGPVDYECRPYELGWMLYAWLSDGAIDALRPAAERGR
jgi:hypothetical protein